MISIQRKFTGEVSPCPDCGNQPQHVHVLGPDMHYIWCPPCHVRMPKRPTLQQALEVWELLPREIAAEAAH